MTSVSNKSPAQVIRVLCKLVTKINEFIQTFVFLFFICSSPMNELISIDTYFFLINFLTRLIISSETLRIYL